MEKWYVQCDGQILCLYCSRPTPYSRIYLANKRNRPARERCSCTTNIGQYPLFQSLQEKASSDERSEFTQPLPQISLGHTEWLYFPFPLFGIKSTFLQLGCKFTGEEGNNSAQAGSQAAQPLSLLLLAAPIISFCMLPALKWNSATPPPPFPSALTTSLPPSTSLSSFRLG